MRRAISVFVGCLLIGCGGSTTGQPMDQASPTADTVAATFAATNVVSQATSTRGPGLTQSATTVASKLTTWTDVDGRIRLQYPTAWNIGRIPNSDANIAYFATGTGSLSVNAFPTRAGFSADDAARISTGAHASSKVTKYLNETVAPIGIGGLPGRVITSQSLPRDNSTTEQSLNIEWVTVQGSTIWNFFALGHGIWDRSEVDAVIASVTFLP